jgi:hypothetical protein
MSRKTSLQALLEAVKDDKAFAEERNVWSVELFDHEEVGR